MIIKEKRSRRKSASVLLAERTAAEILACPVRRPLERMFLSIAIAWKSEAREIARAPQISLVRIGVGLGLDYQDAARLAAYADQQVDRMRRVDLGGQTARKSPKLHRWVRCVNGRNEIVSIAVG